MALTSIDLSKYVRIGRYDLPEPTRTALPTGTPAWNLLAQEASAVTYNKDTDTLFVLGDGGTAIVQVSKTGTLINTMTLAKGSSPQGTAFYDPEGLAYIGGDKFVLVEERDRQVVEFTYTANTTLERAATKTVKLGSTIGNIGLEGVTFDPSSSNAYILVKETGPLDIFLTSIDFSKVTAGTISDGVTGVASNGSSTRVDGTNQLFLPSKATGLADFADVYALSNVTALAGTTFASDLLILSQESGKVLEIGRDGTVHSSLTLLLDAGSTNSIPDQSHEGITMDAAGNIYIVSENGGGDVNHPQMWVYAASTAANIAPTSLVLNNQVTSIFENIPISARYKLADIAIVDDGLGTNALSVSGADAASFEVDASGLYLKTGTVLDYETKNTYAVTVNVDDVSVGATPDASNAFSLALVDVVNENAPLPALAITEASPWSSGNSLYKADWFEVTNTGSTTVDLTGLRFDDDSNAFGSSVALQGVSSLAPGKSAVFIEAVDSEATTISLVTSAFKADWFGTNVPAGFQIGTYTGSGVGLSTGGDAVNLFDQFGRLITGIKVGASTPYQTFSNGAGAGSTSNPPTISTLSSLGANSFASAVAAVPAVAAIGTTPEVKAIKEIGSPGQASLSIKFSGVASGSATANTGIFWTRTWRADSTELLGAAADLTLEVSEKADFSVIAFSKTTNTAASSDYTTKVDLSGLSAGTSYYYRFKTTDGASISDVGQFKTVPAPTSTGTIRFGHGGDIDGLMAPYLSTQDLKTQKLDFFIFNGDTIYETAATGSPATAATKDVEAETKNADGSLKATAATLLADYRRKYLETHMGVTATTGVPTSAPGYYQGLDTFFAAQGLYVSLDNHELGNKDIINGGAPLALRTTGNNGSTNTADDVNTTGTYIHDSTSFKTLEQAFLEYQPIRQTVLSTPTDKRTDGTVQLYGSQQWGKNVVEINLDSRTYRDVRLNKIDPVTSVRSDDTGSRADNPDRTLLGATQLAWLKKTLLDAQTAGTVWKFINTSDPIDQIGAVGSGDDGGKSWMGGYRAERNDLLKFIADNGITNVVFLASDDHQGRINEVFYVADPTQPTVYTKVPGVISIVDGAMGATGPDTNTDHTYTAIKKLADDFASKQTTNGVDPIGLDPNYAGLFNVWREGDTTAKTAPKAVDFYSPDTYNYAVLEVSPEGNLNVTLRGINSYAKNSFPTASPSNQPREILGFSIDGNHFVSGTSGNDTNIPTTPGTSTIPLFSGRTQTLTTGSGSDEIDVAILNGHDNSIFTGSGDDVIYAGTRDVITGGTGDDHLWATGGDGNRLDGGLGNDDFIIGTANNRVLGGAGNDVIQILGTAGSNYLNGGAGSDQFWLISGPNEKPAAKQFVMDFNAAEDKVRLLGASFADLSFTQVGGDTLLSVTGTAVGHFMNVNASTLNNQSNFLFI